MQHVLEDGEFSALHLSNAMLAPGATGGRQTVTISIKGSGENVATRELKNLCIANLVPEKKDQQSLDIYLNVSQNITISTQGKNEVHLSGYFEPGTSAEDQMMGGLPEMEMDDDEDEEVDLSDEEEEAEKAAEALKALAKKKTAKAT